MRILHCKLKIYYENLFWELYEKTIMGQNGPCARHPRVKKVVSYVGWFFEFFLMKNPGYIWYEVYCGD